MKTAAKIFILISSITCIWTIFVPIIGFTTIKKMKKGKPSTARCVVTMLFCNFLGGLFLLLSKPSSYPSAE